ncbi:MAG: carboxylase [Deltaproteobacteria bacterium]|jgi:acetyl-CoA carboxylase carboxyltransferase component|nr:carboxylase [Deltaproteobacteria bacterium]
MKTGNEVGEELARIRRGGGEHYHEKAREQGKLFCRDRLARLLDPDSFVEDGVFANALDAGLPADGVVTGTGRVEGRPVCVMANDSTVKAGSWGKRTVEKILRIQERAERLSCPLLYLVDSAGARITDQIEMFPGRRGAGRIFHNQVRLSGRIPQVCLLFGPSAAGGAYIPAFCDVVFMVEGHASMYLGSPRMASEVIGQEVSLEEMGGAKMHCRVSGCGDLLAESEEEALDAARRYLGYLPSAWDQALPVVAPRAPAEPSEDLEAQIPENENKPFDMRKIVDRLIDADSWFEVKRLFAGELLTGLARIDGHPIGVIANQPKVKGGVLFVDSADKAARFIGLCDAFGLPLLYLADVPGFMIGKQVEREGIIRAGAKMIMAMSAATVPRISVIVRKAYGAGLYAMCGPGFEPDACLAFPSAMIAVMGPEAAVNAVYFNKLQAIEDETQRAEEVERLRAEFREDVDVRRLASELVIDAIVEPAALRGELAARFAAAQGRRDRPEPRRGRVLPM